MDFLKVNKIIINKWVHHALANLCSLYAQLKSLDIIHSLQNQKK